MPDDLPVTNRLGPDPAPDTDPESTRVRGTPVAPTDVVAGFSAGHPLLRTHPQLPDVPDVPGYLVTREIARGGMGRVFAARDLVLGRDVAIKVLLSGTGATDAARRFVTESKVTAQLPHPNIPPVYALGTLGDGSPFLAMKLIAGRTLTELLQQRPDPAADLSRFVQTFEQVCLAVGFAHSQGVIHRDLKPANIMIGAFGEVQVMDWGLARLLSEERKPPAGDASADDLPKSGAALGADETLAGVVMGTPGYMSPEQARGEPVDRRADTFALGAILCEVLTGARPFTGKTSAEVVARAATGDVSGAFAQLAVCGADPELVAVAKHCLAPHADDRPADGKAVADAVASYRGGVEQKLRAAERERAAAEVQSIEQRKRRRVQVALAGAVMLMLLGAGAFGWWEDRRAAERRVEAEHAEREKQEEALQRQIRDAAAAAERQALTERVEREKREAELRLQAKDSEAAADNRRALIEAVGRCEAALRADDADTAADALVEIARRESRPGADELLTRIAWCRTDHAMLTRLDAAETFRWTLINGKLPPIAAVEPKWIAAFEGYGIVPGTTPLPEIVRRLNASLIRDRLLLTLDSWCLSLQTANLGAILHAADPDPTRDAIREAIERSDWTLARKRVWDLAHGPVLRDFPTRFVIALGSTPDRILPADLRRDVLNATWGHAPTDLGVCMALGMTYPIGPREGAAERVRWFQAAVAARPRNVPAWLHLGLALYEHGQYDQALTAFRTTLRLDPRSINALVNMGMVLRAQGDPDGAIAAYREALRVDPKSPEPALYNNLGTALGEKNDLDGAVRNFRTAIRLDPRSASAHVNLGTALLKQRNPDAAIPYFRTAIEIDPEFADAHAGLGRALLMTGDSAGAIPPLREALRRVPNNAGAHADLGNALWDKDRDGAIAAFREAVRCAPKVPSFHNSLGLLLVKKEDLKGAIVEYREAIRLDPKYPTPRFNLGKTLWVAGDAAGSITAYRDLLAFDPNHVNARTNLGFVMANSGDLDGAIAEYREVLRIAPDHAIAKTNLQSALKEKARRDHIAPPPREVKQP